MLVPITAENAVIYENLCQPYEAEFAPLTGERPRACGTYAVQTPCPAQHTFGYLWLEDGLPVGFAVAKILAPDSGPESGPVGDEGPVDDGGPVGGARYDAVEDGPVRDGRSAEALAEPVHDATGGSSGNPGGNPEPRFDVAEFFVLPGHRRRGAGRELAHALFAAHPGSWQVRQIEGAHRAVAFWRSVIAGVCPEYVEAEVRDPEWGLVTRQRFTVR